MAASRPLRRAWRHRHAARCLALCLLLHICLSALLQQVAAVKRTMPMIGMDEEDEEHESPGDDDDDDDRLAPSPAQALQQRQKQTVSLRSPVGAFLSGQAQPKNGSRQGSLNPVQREIARQMAYDGSSDVSGLDDSAVAKDAMTPNARGSVGRGGVMSYHGGKVITGSLQVYLIMYGDWAAHPEVASILANFLNSLSGSPWMNINNGYTDRTGNGGTSSVSYGGTCQDAYSHGKSLSDADVLSIVNTCISNGLPRDPNGVYFVISSANVAQGSFCSSYCGWHDDREGLYFGFVGSVKRCPQTCEYQATGPNGASAADGIASIFAHELSEIISDPDATAWYDSRGEEGADKCSWKYGDTYTAANGAQANMKLNGVDYLIQQNWALGQGCTLGWN